MDASTACIVLKNRSAAEHLSRTLHRFGMGVVVASSVEEALENLRFFSPDVVLVGVREATENQVLLAELLRREQDDSIPVVAVLEEGDTSRRQALRLGLTTHTTAACEDGELKLLMQATLRAPEPSARPLSGDLAAVPLSGLLTMFDADVRPVRIRLECGRLTGQILLRGGDILEASIDDGTEGDEAIDAMLLWKEGYFSAEFESNHASAPPRPGPAEAHVHEATFDDDEPTWPEEETPVTTTNSHVAVAHHALALLNALSSYVASFTEPAIVSKKLEGTRRTLTRRFASLDLFEVLPEGMVALGPHARAQLETVEVRDLIRAIAEWVLAFKVDMHQSFPGTLPAGVLRIVADSAGGDLERLGFLQALGVES